VKVDPALYAEYDFTSRQVTNHRNNDLDLGLAEQQTATSTA
jgi:hypothetical protein